MRTMATFADALVAAVLGEIEVDLAAAKHEARDGVLGEGLDFVDELLKTAARKIGHRRHRRTMPQQALRRHHDERLAQVAQHLSAQQVEHLCRRRRHDDLHVVLGAELQETLEPRRRMLGPLPLIAMRQKQHEPR